MILVGFFCFAGTAVLRLAVKLDSPVALAVILVGFFE
jgi:hypothetical protein